MPCPCCFTGTELWFLIIVADLIVTGLLVMLFTYYDIIKKTSGLVIILILNSLLIFLGVLAIYSAWYVILIGVAFLIFEVAVIETKEI